MGKQRGWVCKLGWGEPLIHFSCCIYICHFYKNQYQLTSLLTLRSMLAKADNEMFNEHITILFVNDATIKLDKQNTCFSD